jgi:hypothetical protein
LKLFEVYHYSLPSHKEVSRHLMYARDLDHAAEEIQKWITKGIMIRIDEIWEAGSDANEQAFRVVRHPSEQ